jgi:hypothetical protein
LEKPILELLSRFINTEETQIDFEKISSLPWFEENKTLKVEIEGEKESIEVKTKYPQTVSKLLEMLYKLKAEGFATFI